MPSFAMWTRLALIALSSCALGGVAQADAPAGGAVPPGWVWQGVWQNGQWNGQWIPGPGVTPGAPMPGGDPALMRLAERCHDDREDRHRREHDCAVFFHDHPEFAQGYPAGAQPYPPAPVGPMPYPAMAYAPVGYVMVPVITTAPQQQPCVETKTVTTTYIIEKHRHVVWTRPRRKEKRVYTGS